MGIPLFYFCVLHNAKEEIKNRDLAKDSEEEEAARDSLLKPLRFIYDIYLPRFW